MLFFVVFLLPLYQVYSFLGSWRRSWRPWTTAGVAVALYGFYLYGFWLLGEAFPITSAKHGASALCPLRCGAARCTDRGGIPAVSRGTAIRRQRRSLPWSTLSAGSACWASRLWRSCRALAPSMGPSPTSTFSFGAFCRSHRRCTEHGLRRGRRNRHLYPARPTDVSALHTAERLLLRTLELIISKKKKLIVARQRQVAAADKVWHGAIVASGLRRAHARPCASSCGPIAGVPNGRHHPATVPRHHGHRGLDGSTYGRRQRAGARRGPVR